MKKYFFTALFSFSLSCNLFAQNGVEAYLTYADFNTPDNKPFLETYLTVIGNSLVYLKNEKGKYQGTIEVSIAFSQKDEIKNFKKYNLLSNEVDDEESQRANFIDQQRFLLENGEYIMELEIADKNSKAPSFKFSQPITINYPIDKVSISEIELLESYKPTIEKNILSKSGFDLVPYVSRYYPANSNTVSFYVELYKTNVVMPEKEKYLVNYFIEDFDTKAKVDELFGFTKLEATDVNGFLHEFDIRNLATGNYNLCIEVHDRSNKLLAERKLFFQRSKVTKKMQELDLTLVNIENTFVKNYNNLDSIVEMLRYLRPISDGAEINHTENQIYSGDITLMKKYFYSFWQKRNPIDPKKEWLKYFENVEEVNRLFGTSIRSKKGYNSDRGRVYLQYGKPSVRSVNDHSASSYPYEVWQYDRLASGQTNRRFVFYNPYAGSNDYRLIHSDARGEIYDARWRYKIDERSNIPNKTNLDKETIDNDSYGRQIDDIYRNPR